MLTKESTFGEIWRAMSDEQRERLFFFVFRIAEFYASGDTWFAVSLLPDPPAGLIMGDFHDCEDLGRRAPGGRARIALSWVLSEFRRTIESSPRDNSSDRR
jgi:hypothetical protein